MEFSLSTEQRQLKEAATAFARANDLASSGLLPAATPTGTAAVIPQPAVSEPAALLEESNLAP